MPDFNAGKRQKIRIKNYAEKDFSKARLIDGEFFKACFDGNVEASQVLVDKILAIPGLKVISATIEKHIAMLHSKNIILDLLAETANGERVDIEVQRTNGKHLPKRARYYLSLMTAGMLKPKEKYHQLRDAYVLFICEHDPFGKGRAVYSYAMRDRAAPEADFLNDGSCICFFNCAYKGDDALGKLASDMLSREWRSIEDPVLQSLVKQGKINLEGITMSDYAEKHFNNGYIKGEYDGLEKGREETIIALLRNGVGSPEEIAKALNMPLEDVLAIQKTIEA